MAGCCGGKLGIAAVLFNCLLSPSRYLSSLLAGHFPDRVLEFVCLFLQPVFIAT